MKPWNDPKHPSYQGEATHNCLGCGQRIPYSAWGPWCHPCNSKRMKHLNKRFAQMARSIGDEDAARELESTDER